MPEKETLRRARADKRAGKSASTQAGEFVREGGCITFVRGSMALARRSRRLRSAVEGAPRGRETAAAARWQGKHSAQRGRG